MLEHCCDCSKNKQDYKTLDFPFLTDTKSFEIDLLL